MLHEYKKKTTIKAEQFDGSTEIMLEYGIEANPEGHYYADFPLYTIPTKEGKMSINKGDWIATGIDGEHWAVDSDIFKRTYERVD